MPVETSTSTSTSGGTTTVGASVRDPDPGPGSPTKTLDVTLVIDPAKFEQLSDPVGPTTPLLNVDKDRLVAQWKDVQLVYDSKAMKYIDLNFKWRLQRRSGPEFEGGATGLLIVSERSKGGVWKVERFCICEKDSPLFVLDRAHFSLFSDFLSQFGITPISQRNEGSKAKTPKKKG